MITRQVTPNWLWTVALVSALMIVSQAFQGVGAQSDDRILFVSDRDGNLDIYVMQADGTNVQRLTTDPAVDVEPAWSPNRQQIAFASNRNGNYGVYVMNADGSNPHRVSPDDGNYYAQPTWSPDGQRLALVSDRSHTLGVYTINATGGNLQAVTDHPGNSSHPTWSSDKYQIAFSSEQNGYPEIFVSENDGQPPQLFVTSEEADCSDPAWSPDGQHLAYVATGSGYAEIYIKSVADGSDRILIAEKDAYIQSPTWSPDGQYLAYEKKDSSGKSMILIVNIDGQSSRQAVNMPNSNTRSPSWSAPDPKETVPDPSFSSNMLQVGGQARVYVEDEGLKLRAGPDTDYPIVENLPRGSVVTLIGESQTHGGYVWWQVRSASGNEGWAVEAADGLSTLVPIPALRVGSYAEVYVEDEGLKLRSGPGTDYPIIENLPRRSIITLVGEPQVRGGYVWWQVRSASGNEGWAVEAADGLTTLIPR